MLFSGTALADADLNWTAPTENEDGSALTDLAGFRIYKGAQGGPYTQIGDVNDPAQVSYTDTAGQVGDCYVVTAYNAADEESQYSNEACKAAPMVPAKPGGLTVS